jgi:hypothetical protein
MQLAAIGDEAVYEADDKRRSFRVALGLFFGVALFIIIYPFTRNSKQ